MGIKKDDSSNGFGKNSKIEKVMNKNGGRDRDDLRRLIIFFESGVCRKLGKRFEIRSGRSKLLVIEDYYCSRKRGRGRW